MKQYAYVGCRTTKERNARGKGISVYEIEDGKWNLKQIKGDLINPSYLCMDRTEKFLYTVHGDQSEISSFLIEEDGTLAYINTVSTGGVNPVHLSVDKTNQWIFVANLQTGTVAVIPRVEDGSLQELKQLYTIPGKEEGTVSHPHQVLQDIHQNYLLVSCQGRLYGFGQVDVFRINSDTGELEKTCVVSSREIAEPRHMVFHPNNRFCYGVNQKDYSVTYYQFDEEDGRLEAKQIVPALPDTYTGDGWASGILMEQAGRHLIVSNRKHDSVTCFEINQDNGMLTFKDNIKTEGKQPRFIAVNPLNNTVIAANELSDNLREINVCPERGKLEMMDMEIHTESPVCVIFKQ